MCNHCLQSPCLNQCPNADEPEVVEECCMCGYGIHVDEDYYDVNGDIVCDDCDYDYMLRFRKVGG